MELKYFELFLGEDFCFNNIIILSPKDSMCVGSSDGI